MTEYIFEILTEEVKESPCIQRPGSEDRAAGPAQTAKESEDPELWTEQDATERLHRFRRSALRQLAHMASNRGRRMGERKGIAMKRGYLEEPGTGTFDWASEDVMACAVDQLPTTDDWTGVRFSNNH